MHHPDVFLPAKKELHFFDRHYDDGLERYEAEFAGYAGQKAVGEITPQYFHNPDVAPLIKKHLPDVKLIVSLRNPVGRAYSHYWRLVATVPEVRGRSFEEVLQAPNDILQVGCYFDHLRRYYDLFAAEQVLVLLFDDIRVDPEAFLSQIYRFLAIDDIVNPELAKRKINAAASLQDLGRSKAVWYLYRALRRARLYGLSARLEKANRSELPPMKPETRRWLLDYYGAQIRQLETLIDRDLSAWTTEPEREYARKPAENG